MVHASIADASPRQVLESPNNGLRSGRRQPKSIGQPSLVSSAARNITGAPFAIIISNRRWKKLSDTLAEAFDYIDFVSYNI